MRRQFLGHVITLDQSGDRMTVSAPAPTFPAHLQRSGGLELESCFLCRSGSTFILNIDFKATLMSSLFSLDCLVSCSEPLTDHSLASSPRVPAHVLSGHVYHVSEMTRDDHCSDPRQGRNLPAPTIINFPTKPGMTRRKIRTG